ncbi:conserved hypothetical protein [Uncinocarpus reesii 1704]|uniref:ethanolamine kinase n=1 Tax=Uncinocarpus reesii (strain UAMH 1704) TaxID=336963 RepID=C4JTS8_UNCRE|nr:uncharacterized protein UREG_05867 [Uncinocarpus reesii 1704]EEP81025.1 conserved hypothetical protein [Uncinocarpus reesii 1704]
MSRLLHRRDFTIKSPAMQDVKDASRQINCFLRSRERKEIHREKQNNPQQAVIDGAPCYARDSSHGSLSGSQTSARAKISNSASFSALGHVASAPGTASGARDQVFPLPSPPFRLFAWSGALGNWMKTHICACCCTCPSLYLPHLQQRPVTAMTSGHSTQNGGHVSVRYIPLSYNHADSQASALRLVLALRPEWEHAEGKIEFVRFTDGITNTLLKIIRRAPGMTDEEIDSEAVLMRAYEEVRSHALLSSKGLAPPLLARFKNGLLYRFIRGQVASPHDLTQPPIWRGVARRLAQWHAVLPISDSTTNPGIPESVIEGANAHINGDAKSPEKSNDDITPVRTQGKGTPTLWTVLQKWILALPVNTDKERERRKRLQKEFERIVAELDDKSGIGEDGLVFAHCDLLCANVIRQPKSASAVLPEDDSVETVSFIDYEYATPSPAAFDIANHFAEWGGYDCDYNMMPTRSVRRGFLTEYVRSYSKYADLGKSEQDAVETLFQDVDRFRGIPGFYWPRFPKSISIMQITLKSASESIGPGDANRIALAPKPVKRCHFENAAGRKKSSQLLFGHIPPMEKNLFGTTFLANRPLAPFYIFPLFLVDISDCPGDYTAGKLELHGVEEI